MDLTYGGLVDERRELSDMAQDYLAKSALGPTAGRDLGWFGIGIDEDQGGVGGAFADLAPIIEATGARCAATALIWTTGVLGRLLVEAGGPVARELLPGIAAGTTTVASALADPAVAARHVSVNGETASAELIVHGAQAPDLVLVPLRTDDGPALALVPVEHVRLEALASVDQSRFLHRMSMVGVDIAGPALLTGPSSHDRLRALVAQVAALDAVGAARKALNDTIAYSLDRQQFGRPIGSFQAYKHRCANMFQLFKLAQSGAFRAAEDNDSALALAAAFEGTRSCTRVCGEAVQLHGAIGFSWETGLHGVLKRARSAEIIAANGDHSAEAILHHHDVPAT